MGFTKKQRREQKKQHAGKTVYVKKRRVPRQAPGEQPAAPEPQAKSMVLIKVSWTEPEGELHQDVQLAQLPTGHSEEQLRQEILARLQARGRKDCAVETFDPDNVPAGVIPPEASVTFNEQPLLSW
jgi:hypothetical protein